MPADMGAICADLQAEQDDLDRVVAALDSAAWDTPTPAEGWTVRDQVAHLTQFDEKATLAARDHAAFVAELGEIANDPVEYLEGPLRRARAMAPAEVLARWRAGRAGLLATMGGLDPATRIAWYGPAMSAASFATARLMEAWCHGQDVVDGLGVERAPTARLRHIAHIAVRARAFNYASHGREVPAAEVRVELRAPDGSTWAWGPAEAADRITGKALDFALVATQRRHPDDVDLRADGAGAREWLAIIQAFAGPPGPGRRPGQFPRRAAPAGGAAAG